MRHNVGRKKNVYNWRKHIMNKLSLTRIKFQIQTAKIIKLKGRVRFQLR